MNKKYVRILLGLLLVVLALILKYSPNHVVRLLADRLNYISYDLHLRAPRHVPPNPVVIIDIDEKTLREEGRWPWPRNKLAALVKNIIDQGSAVLAIDMLFPDSDINIIDEITQALPSNSPERPTLQKLHSTFDFDQLFANEISKGSVVLSEFFSNEIYASKGELGPPILVLDPKLSSHFLLPSLSKFVANLPILVNAAKHTGSTNILPDQDGILRRAFLITHFQNKLYPSLALEAVRLYLLENQINLYITHMKHGIGITGIGLGSIKIPTDPLGQMLIPYIGMTGSFPYYSATDVLHNKLAPEALAGKLVFLGTSAIGLGDTHATPLQGGGFPGIEVHANIAASILDAHFIHTPWWGNNLESALTLFVGLFLTFLLPFLSPLMIVFVMLLVLVGLFLTEFLLWVFGGTFISFIFPTTLTILLGTIESVYGYYFSIKRRIQLQHMFGEYVPAEHIKTMMESDKAYGFEGQTKVMTVLFSDIRNFTNIAESLDADGVSNMLSMVFTPITKAIFDNHGTIDKYVGDMVIAFWNDPLEDVNHAMHAIHAAFKMQEVLLATQPDLRAKNLPEIQIGIGINSGLMHVGDMGSEYRRNYTVLGDEVNLASRLESVTKFYHVSIIVSEATFHFDDDIIFRYLDKIRVKGKKLPVKVYEPLCLKANASAELIKELEEYSQALELYYKRSWEETLERFETLSAKYPEIYVYQLYKDRTVEFMKNPPDKDWDGIYVLSSK